MKIKLFLIITIVSLISSCTKDETPQTDFNRYCSFVTEVVGNEKYTKDPFEHLKRYSEFRKGGVSKALAHILVVIQKIEKNVRAEIFHKAANKVMKTSNWSCPAYAAYVEKFTPSVAQPPVVPAKPEKVEKPVAKPAKKSSKKS